MFTGKRLAAALILPFHPGISQHDPVHNHGKSLRELYSLSIFIIYPKNNALHTSNIYLSMYIFLIFITNFIRCCI